MVAGLKARLAEALPSAIAEVLLPAIRLRLAPGRMVATLPNPIWQEVFQAYAAEPARTWLESQGLTLALVSRQEPEAEGQRGQRFADFVRDPGNQFALTASRRVVEAPGLEHNPLYIHGPPGCGKSHLLSAISAEFRQMLGDHAVVLLDGPSFVSRDAQALAERGSTPLRLALSHAALICVDQVEALSGRTLAQEELFHLINSSLERGQQIVIAGSEAPRKLPGFEDRLITRLSWGLAVAIEAPLTETRLALLRRLADGQASSMDAGDLTRLVDALAPDMHQVVRLAERLNEGERIQTGDDLASFDRILQVVAERYDLRPGDIAGKRRLRQVAQARQMALLLGRRLTAHSLVALGGMVGGRDHSTVLYSIRQAEERAANDNDLAREVSELTQKILGH
jgi:chromosomal replication initiator protein